MTPPMLFMIALAGIHELDAFPLVPEAEIDPAVVLALVFVW